MIPLADLPLQILFRLMCVRPQPDLKDGDEEDYFRWRMSEAARFLARFDGRVDVRGRTILDLGCGFGSMSVFLAQQGAGRVVGTDIDEERLAFAARKLRSEFPNLSGIVEFAPAGTVTQGCFDLVISQDCFEHYDNPVDVMSAVRPLLSERGRVVIGFSPLWKSPYGGHIGYMTKVPWAHLLFPERIVMRERRRYRPSESACTFAEVRGGLNKMTYEKFLQTMRASGYDVEFLATNILDSRLAPVLNWARRVPYCFEYLTLNIYAIVAPGVSARQRVA